MVCAELLLSATFLLSPAGAVEQWVVPVVGSAGVLLGVARWLA